MKYSRITFNLTYLILLQILICSCVASSDNGHDPGNLIYEPKYASGFKIYGEDGSRSSLIHVTSPWKGENVEARDLFIQRDGEPVPKGYQGPILKEDAERIVCLSPTQIAMLHLADASGNIVGVSGIDKITSPDIASNRADIADIGKNGNINYELLESLKPDLVLLYGIYGADPIENKLKEWGIPYLYVGEYVEESPIGKAEWMIAVAEAVGKRQQAEEVFKQIPEKYNALKQRVESALPSRPKVLLNTPYGDSWYLPPKESYMVALLEDAGAEYLYSENTSGKSKSVTVEEAAKLAAQADKWLNLGSEIKTTADLIEALPDFANLPVVKSSELYNNSERITPNGGNDFFESGVVNPDLVLRDLIKIMYPELVPEPFVYYRKLSYKIPSSTEENDPSLSDLSDIE